MRQIILALMLLVLTGCGGGSSGTQASTAPGNISAPTVSGTASEGLLITGRTVKLKDANGKSAIDTTTNATTGNYSIDVTGLTAPFLVTVTGTNGTYVSLAQTAGTANINPITTTVVALAAGTSDMSALFTSLTPAQLSTINSNYAVKSALVSTSLQAALPTGIKAEDYFTGTITAGKGMDAVFDTYQITVHPTAGITIKTNDASATTVLTIPAATVTANSTQPLPTIIAPTSPSPTPAPTPAPTPPGPTTPPAPTPAPALTSIAITPANSSVAYGLTRQFIATGQYSDGTSAVLSTGITWSSVNICSLNSLNAYTPIAVNSILLGNFSPLSPSAKMDEAHSQFNDIATRAQLGDANAIAQLQSISSILLSLSQAYNASGAGYQADYTAVNNALVQTTSLSLRDITAATANACGLASLRSFKASLLTNSSTSSPESAYFAARAQFTDVANRAKLGETEANWQLNSVATAFLNASRGYNASGPAYTADFYTVQQALTEIQSLVLPVTPATISSNNGLATGVALGASKITATSGGILVTTILTIAIP